MCHHQQTIHIETSPEIYLNERIHFIQGILQYGNVCLRYFVQYEQSFFYKTYRIWTWIVSTLQVLIHYSDVIMSVMVSQITRLSILCSAVYSGADQRKHQSSASLAFVPGIHRWPVNSPHKWPVTRKMFQFDDVIMSNCVVTVLADGLVPLGFKVKYVFFKYIWIPVILDHLCCPDDVSQIAEYEISRNRDAIRVLKIMLY